MPTVGWYQEGKRKTVSMNYNVHLALPLPPSLQPYPHPVFPIHTLKPGLMLLQMQQQREGPPIMMPTNLLRPSKCSTDATQKAKLTREHTFATKQLPQA